MANSLPQISYLSRDFSGIKSDLLEYTKYYIPEMTDFNESDVGIAIIELFSYVSDSLNYYLDRKLNEAYLPTSIERQNVINLCKLIDYKLASRQASTVDLKFSIPLSVGGDLPITEGTVVQGFNEGKNYYFETVSGIVISSGSITGVVGAREGQTTFSYPVGTSDGTELQSFTIDQSPILQSQFTPVSGTTNYTLNLYIDEGVGAIQWYEVESFLTSANNDIHYIVSFDDSERAIVEFGDNVNGKIPTQNSIITTDFRLGGGKETNVPAQTINVVRSQILFSGSPVSISVTNEAAAIGGEDEETIERARTQAPRSLRALYRAVTSEDFITLAQRVTGVAKANVRYDGLVESGEDIGAYTYVFIAPNGGGRPTSTLKQDVQTYLDSRRLITTFPKVMNVRYLDVYIDANIVIYENYILSQVQLDVEDAITEFYKFDNQQLGFPLRLSDFYHLVDAINGVNYLNIDVFSIFPVLVSFDDNSTTTPQIIDASIVEFKKSFYDIEILEGGLAESTSVPGYGVSKGTNLSYILPDEPGRIDGISFNRYDLDTDNYNIKIGLEDYTPVTIDVTGDEGVGGGYNIDTVVTRINNAIISKDWPIICYKENSLIHLKDYRSNYFKYSNNLTQSDWIFGNPESFAINISGALATNFGYYNHIVTTEPSQTINITQSVILPYKNGTFTVGGYARATTSGSLGIVLLDNALPIFTGSVFVNSGFESFIFSGTLSGMLSRTLSVQFSKTLQSGVQELDLYNLYLVSGVTSNNNLSNDWYIETNQYDMPVYTEGWITLYSTVDFPEANATTEVFGLPIASDTTVSGSRGVYNFKVKIDNDEPIIIDISGDNGIGGIYTYNSVKDKLTSALTNTSTVSGDGSFLYITSPTYGINSFVKILSAVDNAPDRDATFAVWGTQLGIDRVYQGDNGIPFEVSEYDYSTSINGIKVAVTSGFVGTTWSDGYLQFTLPVLEPITFSGYTYEVGDTWRCKISNQKEDMVLQEEEMGQNNARINLTFEQES